MNAGVLGVAAEAQPRERERACPRVSAHLYNHAGEADLLCAELRALGVTLR